MWVSSGGSTSPTYLATRVSAIGGHSRSALYDGEAHLRALGQGGGVPREGRRQLLALLDHVFERDAKLLVLSLRQYEGTILHAARRSEISVTVATIPTERGLPASWWPNLTIAYRRKAGTSSRGVAKLKLVPISPILSTSR